LTERRARAQCPRHHHAGDVLHRRRARVSRLPVDDPRRAHRQAAGARHHGRRL